MRTGLKAIVWFKEVTKNDIPLVGGKGANLGEMTNAGIPVPPGFIVTADAYFDFLDKPASPKKSAPFSLPWTPITANSSRISPPESKR